MIVKWSPKKDISVYELALCIPALTRMEGRELVIWVKTLSEDVQRHFIVEEEDDSYRKDN